MGKSLQEPPRQPTYFHTHTRRRKGFPVDSDGKESACNAGDLSKIPGLGRSPWGRYGHSLYYSCLEHPHEQRSLAGYGPWGLKELDTTERLSTHAIERTVSTSVQFNLSVVSDSLWPHELQHSRPPCPLSTPRVCSDSCPSSQWCHPNISSVSPSSLSNQNSAWVHDTSIGLQIRGLQIYGPWAKLDIENILYLA